MFTNHSKSSITNAHDVCMCYFLYSSFRFQRLVIVLWVSVYLKLKTDLELKCLNFLSLFQDHSTSSPLITIFLFLSISTVNRIMLLFISLSRFRSSNDNRIKQVCQACSVSLCVCFLLLYCIVLNYIRHLKSFSKEKYNLWYFKWKSYNSYSNVFEILLALV